ncbi:MAG: neutral/alkaline non-lysosomal ceramidase N-terminal domain-containing protein [Candidatus Hydrogenedentota bacterium]
MWIGMLALVSSAMVQSAAGGGWMAGSATVDITPHEPMWLAGYAARDHEAESTLHPLWLKALALEDAAGNRALLITADVLGFPKPASDRIRNRIERTHDLTRGQVILSASHTHSGPVLDESLLCIYPLDDAGLAKVKAYTTQLEDHAVAAAQAAFDALAPAQLAAGNGVCRFAVNRRNNNEREILKTYDFEGPVDHAAPVLKVTGEDGEAKAILFGYACHNTTLSGYDWCGDWAGFAQLALEREYPGATAMFFAGCGADQNPLPRRTIPLAKQYGEELAAAVARVLTEAMMPLAPELKTAYTETILALEEPPTREELEAKAAESSGYMKRAAEAFLAELDADRPLHTEYPYPVQAWQLGGQTLVALGGEVTVGYSVGIKKLLGHDTFVMAYANDVMSYIPTETVLAEGGYEGDTSQFIYGMPAKWQPGLEAQILDTVKQVAAEAGVAPE